MNSPLRKSLVCLLLIFMTHSGFPANSIPDQTVSTTPDTSDSLLPAIKKYYQNYRRSEAAAGAFRIMPIGDSITEGKFAADSIGFRKVLYDLLHDHGYNIDFVGFNGQKPYEGHFDGGRKISDFYPRSLGNGGTGRMDVTVAMDNERPNMVVIHLGTNDLNSETGTPVSPYGNGDGFANTQAGQMGTLVNYLLKWHNGNKGTDLQYIVVSLIIPMRNRDSVVVAFNIEVSRLVQDFQKGVITGQPEPVYLCDQFTRFREQPFDLWTSEYRLMADKLHPNTRGHQLMGEIFFQTIDELLSGNKKWFSDITWQAGTSGFDAWFSYQGIAVADATGDGLDDLFLTRTASDSPHPRDGFYIGQNDLPFNEDAPVRHVADEGGSRGVVFVDIDNDGDLDVFNGNAPGRNRLYENLGDGTFQDITDQAGIDDVNALTTTVLAFDADNDGDMDLFALTSRDVNEFYLNDGNGHFTRMDRGLNDVSEPDIPNMSAAASDFDADGDVDVYVVKRGAPNRLFVNNGAGYFTDQAHEAGLDLNDKCNGATWVDLDNDGDLDLLVTLSHTEIQKQRPLYMFRNSGNGHFEDLTQTINLSMDGYSVLNSDFDNDGYIDLITTNERDYGVFYRNLGNWVFEKVNDTGAEIHAGDVRGATTFDYDNDGDEDIIAARSDVFNVFLQNNLDNGNGYLQVKAYGPNGNAGGYGTKIWLFESGQLGEMSSLLGFREIVSASGHQSQPSPIQHFGLGTTQTVDLLARFTDGTMLAIRDVAVNQRLTIKPELLALQSSAPASIQRYDGDGQSARVTENLSKPLVARVTDATGRPVSGVKVDFRITEGDATLLLPTTNDGSIWLEMERGHLDGAMQWALDESASGQGFVMVPDFIGQHGQDTLTMAVPRVGDYYLWLRMAKGSGSGEVSVSTAGDSPLTMTINHTDGWQWLRFADANGDPYLFALSTDSVRLVVQLNNDGVQADKMLFTPDPEFVPVGMGDDGDLSPEMTDRDGLARRMVKLGTTAGAVTIEAEAKADTVQIEGNPVIFHAIARPGLATTMAKTSGDGQIGRADEPLPQPFVVTLFDAFDNPVPGKQVRFSVISGGGTLNPDGIVYTDSSGQASVVYTPGDEKSIQQVQAEADSVTGSPVTFTVTIEGLASDLLLISGDQQADTVNAILSQPIIFRVVNNMDSGIANYPVNFSILSGGGSLLPAQAQGQSTMLRDASLVDAARAAGDSLLQVTTDANGYASVRWQLGTQAGHQQLLVEADGLSNSPMTITATASAGSPAFIVEYDGNHQVGQVTKTLPRPLRVRVTDQFLNPIENQSVTFLSTSGGGTFATDTVFTTPTDSLGLANASFTLGQVAGTDIYHVRASAAYQGKSLSGSPVEFVASATPGPAATASYVTGNAQVDTVANVLPEPFRIKVTDQFANPVSGYSVTFSVVKGNGHINGESSFVVESNGNGVVSVFFTLGTHAGVNSDQVRAAMPGLQPESILFTASTVADVPARIEYVSGNDQSGPISSSLPQPLTVRITDRYENPVANHSVEFEVVSDPGTIDGAKKVTRLTDKLGVASVHLTLGDLRGDSNHIVTARSFFNHNELFGSPIVFYASAISGPPAKVVSITDAQNLVGAANSELNEPLRVKVLDNYDNPVPNVPVTFIVISGGGYFPTNHSQQDTMLTDSQGIAQIRWVLGEADKEQRVAVLASYQGQYLQGAPLFFPAAVIVSWADHLRLISGDGQSGPAGEVLERPFVVQVLDQQELPVSQHPVLFKVIQGGGRFVENDDSLLIVKTDARGWAAARLVLGGAVGANSQVVRASSQDSSGAELSGSPIAFTASATAGTPDPNSSDILVDQYVPANGHPASISVVLRDRFNNPVPDRQVHLQVTGMSVQADPSSGLTDSLGVFRSTVSSFQSGEVVVRAQDVTSDKWLASEGKIQFISTAATRIVALSGIEISGYRNSMLPESLSVRVEDNDGNPVAGYPILFSAPTDSARVLTPQPIYSDVEGVASAAVVLGANPGTFRIRALAPGLLGHPITFSITSMVVQDVMIDIDSGDGQQATVLDTIPGPLRVFVHDARQRPIAGIAVEFVSETDQIAQVLVPVDTSDQNGLAQSKVRLGQLAGVGIIAAKLPDFAQAIRFHVHALPDRPARLSIESGDGQRVQVGKVAPQPLMVRLSDRYGNPVPQGTIKFTIVAGSAHLIGADSVHTDSMGLARMSVRMGHQSGRYEVQATATELPDRPVRFVLTGLPAAAREMVVFAGNNQHGVAGHALGQPIRIKILDQYQNGVPEISVVFTPQVESGHVLPGQNRVSDSLGVVSVQWVLGPTPGTQILLAAHQGLQNSPLTFVATAIANSSPQFVDLPTSIDGKEDIPITFQVHATDADGDSVTLHARNVPAGASFDSSSTGKFYWKPTFQQAGTYYIQFIALDDVGGKTEREVTITVANVNRAPKIVDRIPREQELGTRRESIDFRIVAEDADGDLLHYLWLVNDAPQKDSSGYHFDTNLFTPGDFVVTALVFDAEDTAQTSWHVRLATRVELSSFGGQFVPFKGTVLRWETSLEKGNAGFYVARANSREGPFQIISDFIRSRAQRRYQFTDRMAAAGGKYFYQLQNVALDGNTFAHTVIEVTPPLPQRYALRQNYPNPFNPATMIRFELPHASHVHLVVYDVLGQKVRTLLSQSLKPGYHAVSWDGTNDLGQPVASGVYYYTLRAGTHRMSKKMVLVH